MRLTAGRWLTALGSQKSGRLVGMPDRRGYLSGQLPDRRRIVKESPGVRRRSTTDRPSVSRPSGGQRSGAFGARAVEGGSETTRTPPILRRGAAHSAVMAGGPNDRAVIPLSCPRNEGSLPSTSARHASTNTLSSRPSRLVALSRKADRRSDASMRQALAVGGNRSASTRPGSPPPDPRSPSIDPPVAVPSRPSSNSKRAATSASACATWRSIAAGPMKPRACAFSKMSASALRDLKRTGSVSVVVELVACSCEVAPIRRRAGGLGGIRLLVCRLL